MKTYTEIAGNLRAEIREDWCDKIEAADDLLTLVELHANQCSEWSSRMFLCGNLEEAEAYKKDESVARAAIAKATQKSS